MNFTEGCRVDYNAVIAIENHLGFVVVRHIACRDVSCPHSTVIKLNKTVIDITTSVPVLPVCPSVSHFDYVCQALYVADFW